MIFVVLGTQEIPFKRMLEMVDNLVEQYNIEEEIVVQTGHTMFESKYFRCIPFMDEIDFQKHIKQASVIITHAGSGAIFNAIKSRKKTIAVARLKEYNEMPDNHQIELVKKLTQDGYILNGTFGLSSAWEQLLNFKPRENDFSCNIHKELANIFNL